MNRFIAHWHRSGYDLYFLNFAKNESVEHYQWCDLLWWWNNIEYSYFRSTNVCQKLFLNSLYLITVKKHRERNLIHRLQALRSWNNFRTWCHLCNLITFSHSGRHTCTKTCSHTRMRIRKHTHICTRTCRTANMTICQDVCQPLISI